MNLPKYLQPIPIQYLNPKSMLSFCFYRFYANLPKSHSPSKQSRIDTIFLTSRVSRRSWQSYVILQPIQHLSVFMQTESTGTHTLEYLKGSEFLSKREYVSFQKPKFLFQHPVEPFKGLNTQRISVPFPSCALGTLSSKHLWNCIQMLLLERSWYNEMRLRQTNVLRFYSTFWFNDSSTIVNFPKELRINMSSFVILCLQLVEVYVKWFEYMVWITDLLCSYWKNVVFPRIISFFSMSFRLLRELSECSHNIQTFELLHAQSMRDWTMQSILCR